MSKIGRKPIDLGSVSVEINNNIVTYKGKNKAGVYELPESLDAKLKGKHILLTLKPGFERARNEWGLHRSLLANAIKGADVDFTKQLRIVGLGYKAEVSGAKVQFHLGFAHKVDFVLPQNVALEIDKSKQLLTFKSADKMQLGLVCSKVRALRPPEPYKGTGIQYVDEVIRRKAGKAKSS